MTRSARYTASAMSCVMKIAVFWVLLQMRRSSCCIVSRVCASSAANGSSSKSSSGSVEGAREVDALLHAAGELGRPAVGETGETDQIDQLPRDVAPFPLLAALHLE